MRLFWLAPCVPSRHASHLHIFAWATSSTRNVFLHFLHFQGFRIYLENPSSVFKVQVGPHLLQEAFPDSLTQVGRRPPSGHIPIIVLTDVGLMVKGSGPRGREIEVRTPCCVAFGMRLNLSEPYFLKLLLLIGYTNMTVTCTAPGIGQMLIHVGYYAPGVGFSLGW